VIKLNRRSVHSRSALGLALVLAVLLSSFGWSQQPKVNPLAPKELPSKTAEAPEPAPHQLVAADIEAFFDGMMPLQLDREDMAGAVVLVVKDGRILYSKGYGYSDVSKRTPVTADRTLFRPGSISKLFTWTAVMQLVEQGKLDLDRDVNDYLDFKIPATYPKPITLRNIMTHTPGFEETIQDLFVSKVDRLIPLGDYLKSHVPTRIFPPGTTPAYSNYGTALAGYIVQRQSGEKFDDYIEQHILNPLGMNRSTFRQPLPKELEPLMSKGYQTASKPPKPFELVLAAPAGSASVTATDMARFMTAHLQDGHFENAQILRPETAQLMHSAQFTSVPGMNAMALGFYEETRNGHRIIGHAGDTEPFHSDLHLIPDAGLGFFISYNSAGKGENSPRTTVWDRFLDRYFPYQPAVAPDLPSAAADAQAVSGPYISSRRADTTVLSVLSVLGGTNISRNPDNTISTPAFKDLAGQPKKFKEIGPLMFREVHGQDRLAFKRTDSGRLVAAIDFPFMVLQQAHWYQNGTTGRYLIIACLVVLVLTLILWPVAALVRRHYGVKLDATPAQRRLRLLLRLACVVNLVFLLAFAGFVLAGTKDIGVLSTQANGLLRLIQVVGWIAMLGSLVAIYSAIRAWLDPHRWVWTKLAETVVALACVGFLWFVLNWHLLHWSLHY
jgi:CubicO group peptidase (beta-lactamase class C family)